MKFSVVVPTYNRRRLLKRCLARLISQDLDPAMYEILVADDENSLQTQELVEHFSHQYLMHRICYVPTGQTHGPAAARNCGWRKAKGEIVAFTDDDCLPTINWLSMGLTHFDSQTDAIWGQVIVPLPKNPTDYQLNVAGLSKGEFVTANCFCRKSILEAIGGFDERFYKAWREDSDLYFTLIEQQANLKYVPEAVILHPASKAQFGKSIWMQENNLFEPLLYRKHPALYRKYASLPILRMFYVIVLLLLGTVISLLSHNFLVGKAAFLCWLVLTVYFIHKRLLNSSQDTRHILEMIVTSIFIPPLAVFWRIRGKVRFKNI